MNDRKTVKVEVIPTNNDDRLRLDRLLKSAAAKDPEFIYRPSAFVVGCQDYISSFTIECPDMVKAVQVQNWIKNKTKIVCRITIKKDEDP